jgi:hypothetical protein
MTRPAKPTPREKTAADLGAFAKARTTSAREVKASRSLGHVRTGSDAGVKRAATAVSQVSASVETTKRRTSPVHQRVRKLDAGHRVDTLGNKVLATLLGVSESQPSRWRRSEEVPSAKVAPVLLDLDHIVGRLLLIWDKSVIGDWLTGSNAFLGGARPIDVLVLKGAGEVMGAIEAEAAGAYA